MKSMKKSMFVTTILMVVLLIVALSTATFAWYTANTNVGTTKVALTSATSTTASIVIDNIVADSNSTNSSVNLTLGNAQSANVPMVYASASAALPSVGTTTYADFITKFVTFTKDSNGKFASAVTTANPSVLSGVSGNGSSTTYIVLTNVGGGSLASLSTTVTIDPFYTYTSVASPEAGSLGSYYEQVNGAYVLTSDTELAGGKTYYTRGEAGNDYLRVAVFAATAYDGDYLLKGIYGAGSTTSIANRSNLLTGEVGSETSAVTVGTTVINTAVGAATFGLTASGNQVTIGTSVASGSAIFVKVAVWFEGASMLNADAGQMAAFSMSFAG